MFWLKDGEPLDVSRDGNLIISNEGSLIINQARLDDSGNYTCGAQNIASRRLSESAILTVFGDSSSTYYLIQQTLILRYLKRLRGFESPLSGSAGSWDVHLRSNINALNTSHSIHNYSSQNRLDGNQV